MPEFAHSLECACSGGGVVAKIASAVILLVLWAVTAVAESWTWIPVETVAVDWNDDGQKDRIILEAAKEIIETRDPGDFHRLRIQIAGRPEFVLENVEGWVFSQDDASALSVLVDKIAGPFIYKASAVNRFKSIVRSDYFALTPVSPRRNKEFVLLLFGYQYASMPGKLYVIALDREGRPTVIFDKELEVSRLEDLDKNDKVELIGDPGYGEVFGPDNTFHSYAPTYIYSFFTENGCLHLRLNIELSKKFNEENYYGWVSPEEAQEYVVVEPKDGSRPRIMRLTEADRIYGRASVK